MSTTTGKGKHITFSERKHAKIKMSQEKGKGKEIPSRKGKPKGKNKVAKVDSPGSSDSKPMESKWNHMMTAILILTIL